VAGKGKNHQADVRVKMSRQLYERELYRLQGQLVKMHSWMQATGARMVVIF
jgi:polyphosphate kinase